MQVNLWVQPASVQNGRRPRVILRMSAANRAARPSIKIPWNKFGYDRLPERFSKNLPGSKRKKKPRIHKEWPVVRGDLVSTTPGRILSLIRRDLREIIIVYIPIIL